MAMFTTPARSHSTPESEPKISGMASEMDPASSPYRATLGVLALPTAQDRNAATNTTPKMTGSQIGIRRPLRTSTKAQAAASTRTTAAAQPNAAAENTRSGRVSAALGSVRRKVTSVSGAPRAKPARPSRASTPSRMGVFQLRTTAASGAGAEDVVVAVLMLLLRLLQRHRCACGWCGTHRAAGS